MHRARVVGVVAVMALVWAGVAVGADFEPPRCVPASEVAHLNATHAKAFDVWKQEDVTPAWREVTMRLVNAGVSGWFVAYFTADGRIEAVAYSDIIAPDRIEALCAAVRTWTDYRWPLESDRPFQQCGSIHVNVGPRERGPPPLELTLAVEETRRCVGHPMPAVATLQNVSGAPVKIFTALDGTMRSGITIGLHLEGEGRPVRMPSTWMSSEPEVGVVKIVELEPMETVLTPVDLGAWLLPSGTPLGDTPGKYRLIADHLSGSSGVVWSGMVWSNHVEIEVVECAGGVP